MKLFNTLFYGNKLKCMRNPEDANAFWMSRRKTFPGNAPIKFINVEGTEERDKDSPSWFNFSELNVVFLIWLKI